MAVEFNFQRTLDAPRQRVWDAFTKEEHLKHWWGPAGMKNVTRKLELRPGGLHHYSMDTPTGETWWGRWVFEEVTPPERLVFISSFSDAEGGVTRAPFAADFPAEVRSVITFEAQGDKTVVTLRGEPIHASEAERKFFEGMHASMQNGWGGTFDGLAKYLATIG
jgi:uncharacterized protein YndB with AHSA1/START domain